ncbi:hypothetical protein ACFFRR_008944 [Megaselia abdita]
MKPKKVCCLSLETGAIVVAGIQMFLCAISLVIGSIAMDHKEGLVDNVMNSNNLTWTDSDPDVVRAYVRTYIEVVLSFLIIACIVNIITDVSMIYGTIKKLHYFLLPWLIVFGFYTCLLVLETVVFTGVSIYRVCTGSYPYLSASLFALLFTILYAYIWICMRTLYKKIKSSKGVNVYWNEKVLGETVQPIS